MTAVQQKVAHRIRLSLHWSTGEKLPPNVVKTALRINQYFGKINELTVFPLGYQHVNTLDISIDHLMHYVTFGGSEDIVTAYC